MTTASDTMDLKRYVASINLTALQMLSTGHRDGDHFHMDHGGVGVGGVGGGGDGGTFEPPVDDNDVWWQSGTLLLLLLLYALVICGGVFGNMSLLLTVCNQQSARFRNPLLVALCSADLLVAGLAAPLTIFARFSFQQRWQLTQLECKATYFMQAVPVAASTISLLMLSLDRYATVKHPRLAQLRERRFLPVVLAIGAWMGAILLCTPLLIAYRPSGISSSTSIPGASGNYSQTPTTINPTNSAASIAAVTTHLAMAATTTSASLQPHAHLLSRRGHESATAAAPSPSAAAGQCYADYGTAQLHTAFVCTFTLLVFVLPAIGVLLNHLGVRKKLCALSLTARAAHGELPLPMPILRRPTHMIIVTGVANAGRAVAVETDSCCGSDEDGGGGGGGGEDEEEEAVAVAAVARPRVVAELRGNRADGQQTTTTTTMMMMATTTTAAADGLVAVAAAAADTVPAMTADTLRLDVGAVRPDERRCMMAETRVRCNPRTPRSIRRGQQAQQSMRHNQHHHHQHHHHRHRHHNNNTRRGGGPGGGGGGGGGGRPGGSQKMPSSELPLPQTSTLRSRRRLANLLVFAAGIFICCWTPHVVCFLGVELGTTTTTTTATDTSNTTATTTNSTAGGHGDHGGSNAGSSTSGYVAGGGGEGPDAMAAAGGTAAGAEAAGAAPMCSPIVSEFSLLLGYAHSAISPLLYWVLNHNSLRQSSTTCATILRLSSIQKFMRAHLRVPQPPPPPSSTNEAALGPFNPRYIKARPQQPPHYRPPASSYQLY